MTAQNPQIPPQIPPLPVGLRRSGRELWTAVTSDFVLDLQEQLILLQTCRIIDRLDQLDRLIRRQGMISPRGEMNPAVTESRQLSLALPRLLASLRLPDESGRQPQHRWSARGHYQQARGHQQEFIAAQQARLLNVMTPS